ncbi:MAG TPA: hypothetical protein VHR36_15100 [Pyrinomonadaceae bacterium]|nr:hypothetical protein [Pyrinomonadaceae bacterium]
MFENSRATAAGAAWPTLGMRSSVGLMNPGMSVWLFILIAYVAHTPVGMVILVQVLNVLALWGLYCFIVLTIPEEKRDTWLWGLILVSVSPLPILFSRKIWACDLLPVFSLLVLVGHWCRKSKWGSFLWGLAGSLIGQIHMSGFFLAVSFLGWTVARDRKSTRWVPWLLGSAIGGIGLLPWLREFVHYRPAGWNFQELITLKFFTQWIAIALGIDLQFSMHSAFWTKFLREPVVYGVPTYVVGMAHLLLLVVGLKIVLQWLQPKARLAYQAHLENSPEARLYLQATLFGVGILMTLSGTRVYAQYLIVLFPFLHLWLAMKLYGKKNTLLAVTLAQVFISVVFLLYVHQNGGVPEGDYGTTYRKQVYQLNP